MLISLIRTVFVIVLFAVCVSERIWSTAPATPPRDVLNNQDTDQNLVTLCLVSKLKHNSQGLFCVDSFAGFVKKCVVNTENNSFPKSRHLGFLFPARSCG